MRSSCQCTRKKLNFSQTNERSVHGGSHVRVCIIHCKYSLSCRFCNAPTICSAMRKKDGVQTPHNQLLRWTFYFSFSLSLSPSLFSFFFCRLRKRFSPARFFVNASYELAFLCTVSYLIIARSRVIYRTTAIVEDKTKLFYTLRFISTHIHILFC